MIQRLLLLLTILCITGCQPNVFGVPQSSWNMLTPEQKQQVIEGYNQRKQIEAQNALIENAINTAGTVLSNPAMYRTSAASF